MTTVNVRYMVDDVEAAIAFYTTHLGFTLSPRRRPPSPTSLGAICACCSVGRRARPGARCPTVAGPVRVDGTASISSSKTSQSREI